MAFPITPVNGQVTTINGITYVYNSSTSSWTRYSMTLPTLSVIVDTFIGNGSTTSYTLSTTPPAKEYITVNIDGVLQQKTAYSVSGSTLSLTGTPISGAVIEVKTTNASATSVLTGLVYDSFTGDGTSSQYNLSTSPTNKNFTIVSVNGVVQSKSSYSVTGSSLLLNSTPALNAPIEVTTFGPAISTGLMVSGANNQIQFNTNGSLASTTNFTFDPSTSTLGVTGNASILGDLYVGNGASSTSFTSPVAIFKDTGLSYVQTAIVNSNGNGSADLISYGNNGDDTQSWADMGFTGNTFNDANYTVTSAGDGYFFVQGNTSFGGNLVIATGNVGTTKDIIFATGGFQAANIKARLYNANGVLSVPGGISGQLVTSAQPNITSVGTLTGLTVAGTTTLQLASDILTTITGATGVVTHDVSVGGVFVHSGVLANFTPNFVNLPTTDSRALIATLVVIQGATPYIPNAVQIAGVAQTIKWVNSAAPSGTASKTDVFSFSFLRSGNTWTVLAQSSTFG